MRDETEGIIVSLTDLSDAVRGSASTADAPLAGLAAESASSSRDELRAAIAQAGQIAEDQGGTAAELDEAAGVLRAYLENVF